MGYAEKIDKLFTLSVAKRAANGPADRLFIELGCPLLRAANDWHIAESVQPDVAHETVVSQTLVRMLLAGIGRKETGWSEPFSMLSGLAIKERWQACLETLDGAYAFADLLVLFSGVSKNFNTTLASTEVKLQINTILGSSLVDWLGITEFDAYPTLDGVTRALFGDAWCDLVLNEAPLSEVRRIVGVSRPEFLPGLVRAQTDEEDLVLPDLGTQHKG